MRGDDRGMDFERVFGTGPAAVGDAPGRVNLLGEHTDYNDGFVLPTAIPQRTFVGVGPNSSETFVMHAPDMGQQSRFTLGAPPAEHFARYVYGCLYGVHALGVRVPALNILVGSEVPIGVGLSSSAALEVATLRALRKLLWIQIDDVEVARIAQRAEIDFAGVHCGIMDQMASSLADTTSMLFLDTRSLQRELLPLPSRTELLVVDSGISRSLADTSYNQRRGECEQAARMLGVVSLRDVARADEAERLPDPLRRRARHVLSENARVLRAREGVDAAAFGALMNASHISLRDDYEVSVPLLDALVARLQEHPQVHGARLTGAGFGGACVALCGAGSASRVGSDLIEWYGSAGHVGRVMVPMTKDC